MTAGGAILEGRIVRREHAAFDEVQTEAPRHNDPLLDLFHNTRHASPRHGLIRDRVRWRLASPWLLRFDWILDAPLAIPSTNPERLCLTRRRAVPQTVFVKTGQVDVFMDHVLPHIWYPVLLYIGNGDLPLSRSGAKLNDLLDHPMIHRVFCENKDLDVDEVTALPIGLHPADMLVDDSARDLRALSAEVQLEAKEGRVFGSWDRAGHAIDGGHDRAAALRFLRENPELGHFAEPAAIGEHRRRLSRHRFALIPFGPSHDSPATFEALIVKTIPILRAGPHAEAYRGLPVAVVDAWEEIVPERLAAWWRELSPMFADMSFVTPEFWWQRLQRYLPPRKRAFLVVGPESHGTHMVTDLLVHSGCHGRSGGRRSWKEERRTGDEDDQPWDHALPAEEDPIVWRRSVPHLTRWPDLAGMAERLERRGYAVTAVVMHRERHAALRSQIEWHHVPDLQTGRANVQRAYRHIFSHLDSGGIPFVVANYESLVNYPEAQALLLQELGIDPPAQPFEIWDGNRKWYRGEAASGALPSSRRADSGEAFAEDLAIFPDRWFPCEPARRDELAQRVAVGKRRMRSSRALFCAIARDVDDSLPSVIARIERAGAMFADYRVVVFENDSRDSTVERLRQWGSRNPRVHVESERLGVRVWDRDRSPERMQHLAACRNRYLDHALEHHADVDYLIVFDSDLPRGFSYSGLASTFGYDDWDMVGSNGLLVRPHGRPWRDPMFFDAWAFRAVGENAPGSFDDVNRLVFGRGEPLVPVWSCFGGLAVYRMEALRGGARYYGGGDCEHVVLHRQMREQGFDRLFLNPSQIVLYSAKG